MFSVAAQAIKTWAKGLLGISPLSRTRERVRVRGNNVENMNGS